MNEYLKWALLAGAGYIGYIWWTADEETVSISLPGDPSTTRPPASPTTYPGSIPGATPPDVAVPPNGYTPDPGVTAPPSPPREEPPSRSAPRGRTGSGTTGPQLLKARMLEASTGDPNIMNAWVWNFYYSHVTNGPELPMPEAQLFPGMTKDQIGGMNMTWDQWFAVMAPLLPARLELAA